MKGPKEPTVPGQEEQTYYISRNNVDVTKAKAKQQALPRRT